MFRLFKILHKYRFKILKSESKALNYLHLLLYLLKYYFNNIIEFD